MMKIHQVAKNSLGESVEYYMDTLYTINNFVIRVIGGFLARLFNFHYLIVNALIYVLNDMAVSFSFPDQCIYIESSHLITTHSRPRLCTLATQELCL